VLSGKAAIVGIGATDFSKNSGRSELRLAAEPAMDALDDAGLTPADVDGMVTFTMDSNTEVAIARARGIGELKFFSKIHTAAVPPAPRFSMPRSQWRPVSWIALSRTARLSDRCRGLRCRVPRV
jgi:hypothetical protein